MSANPINPITPRTESVTIFQGDDQARLDELKAAADAAKKAAGDEKSRASQLAVDLPSQAQAEREHDEFLAEATERAVTVLMRAVGRKTWRDLVAKHPPRPDNQTDERMGINSTEFGDSLVPASMASPVFATEEQRDAFLDSLSDVQFEELYLTAWALNRVSSPAPKALSERSPISAGTSS